MEAAINVERYGNLEKEFIDQKEYQIEVNNTIQNDGSIKMLSTDMVVKYNQLLNMIVEDEIDYRIAQLIDLELIEITSEKTKIKVIAIFFNENEIETLLIPSQNYIPPCTYEEEHNLNYDLSLLPPLELTLPTNISQIQPYFNSPAASFQGQYLGFGGVSLNLSWIYRQSAEHHGFYTYFPTPAGTNGVSIYNPYSSGDIVDWVPYTNVFLFNDIELRTMTGCNTFAISGEYYPTNTNSHSKNLYKLKYFNDYIESTLPNSNTIEYATVNNIIYSHYGSSLGANQPIWTLRSWNLGFVYYQNN